MPLTCSTATAEWCSAAPSTGLSIGCPWLDMLGSSTLSALRTDATRELLKFGSVQHERLLNHLAAEASGARMSRNTPGSAPMPTSGKYALAAVLSAATLAACGRDKTAASAAAERASTPTYTDITATQVHQMMQAKDFVLDRKS